MYCLQMRGVLSPLINCRFPCASNAANNGSVAFVVFVFLLLVKAERMRNHNASYEADAHGKPHESNWGGETNRLVKSKGKPGDTIRYDRGIGQENSDEVPMSRGRECHAA
ncbi:hypothetical protein [Robbsia sp. KACC 23696]|uniref:hypothetical protein n=1 Tax=Robbsia sp. KACC 23696 TaxID=3149231 RepID=UPI00325B5AB7